MPSGMLHNVEPIILPRIPSPIHPRIVARLLSRAACRTDGIVADEASDYDATQRAVVKARHRAYAPGRKAGARRARAIARGERVRKAAKRWNERKADTVGTPCTAATVGGHLEPLTALALYRAAVTAYPDAEEAVSDIWAAAVGYSLAALEVPPEGETPKERADRIGKAKRKPREIVNAPAWVRKHIERHRQRDDLRAGEIRAAEREFENRRNVVHACRTDAVLADPEMVAAACKYQALIEDAIAAERGEPRSASARTLFRQAAKAKADAMRLLNSLE